MVTNEEMKEICLNTSYDQGSVFGMLEIIGVKPDKVTEAIKEAYDEKIPVEKIAGYLVWKFKLREVL